MFSETVGCYPGSVRYKKHSPKGSHQDCAPFVGCLESSSEYHLPDIFDKLHGGPGLATPDIERR